MGRSSRPLPLHLEADMQPYSPQRDTAIQEVKQEAVLSSPCPHGLSFLKEHGGNSKVNVPPKAVPLIIHPFFPPVFSNLE